MVAFFFVFISVHGFEFKGLIWEDVVQEVSVGKNSILDTEEDEEFCGIRVVGEEVGIIEDNVSIENDS